MGIVGKSGRVRKIWEIFPPVTGRVLGWARISGVEAEMRREGHAVLGHREWKDVGGGGQD